MKGGVVWYLSASPSTVPQLVNACASASITLGHRVTGGITYLDDREGHEGAQVAMDEDGLISLLQRRLARGGDLTVQFWTDSDNDLVCKASAVDAWLAYCFWFDLDGFTPSEGTAVAHRLLRATPELDDITLLRLDDRVGMTPEFGPPHLWKGDHAPAWPVLPNGR